MTSKEQSYDDLVKLIIIGNSGVGKTNILLRFCEDNFQPSHLTTIGIDFKIKTIPIEGKKIRMQIWDTAGQQKFRTITQTYYKGAVGIILVYSVNDRNSFEQIQNWMRQIKIHAAENVVKLILGNKCDTDERTVILYHQVSVEEGIALGEKYGVTVLQTSAKTNVNIVKAFTQMGTEINRKILVPNKGVRKNSTILDARKQKLQRKQCC